MLLAERLIPARFTNDTYAASLQQLELLDGELAERISTDGLLAIQGRALYPSYLSDGVGNDTAELPRLALRDFDRLTFLLIGPDMWDVVMPLDDAGVVFPQGSDILLLACPQENYLEARAVMFLDGERIIQSEPSVAGCN